MRPRWKNAMTIDEAYEAPIKSSETTAVAVLSMRKSSAFPKTIGNIR